MKKLLTPIVLALTLLASCSKEDGEKQQDTINVKPKYPQVTVYCDYDNHTEVVDVTNPVTGKT